MADVDPLDKVPTFKKRHKKGPLEGVSPNTTG